MYSAAAAAERKSKRAREKSFDQKALNISLARDTNRMEMYLVLVVLE